MHDRFKAVEIYRLVLRDLRYEVPVYAAKSNKTPKRTKIFSFKGPQINCCYALSVDSFKGPQK